MQEKSLNLKKAKEKIVFNLDYRLAPFKACVLFHSSLKDESIKKNNNINDLKRNLNLNDNLDSIANSLKKLFVLNQINVMLMDVANENDIESKYDSLDEMGVPYVVYLPSTIVKDGICFIRSRDTTLSEKTHLSLVVKQFSSISNALHF
jgi:glycyl-tRNA synthetase (class II)